MNEQEKLIYNSTFDNLLTAFSTIAPSEINTIPFEGSWTAGELVQHIVLASAGFAEILEGPTEDAGRQPDEKIQLLKDIFLNFSLKMESPDFILPEKRAYDQKELTDKIKAIQINTAGAIERHDLNLLCTGFELPKIGHLTGLEAIYFVIYHTQRHTHQLTLIAQSLQAGH